MPIPENEAALPLVEAVHRATGRRPHLSTVVRWCQKRNRYGVKLESWFCGSRRLTSVEAVRRYNQAITDAANGPRLPVSSTAQRTRAHSAAMAELSSELG